MPLRNSKPKISYLKLVRSFTLVELLVVVAIMGIVASAISVALVGHQKQARDTQRKNDMQYFKKVMEQARGDCYGQTYYPLGRNVGGRNQLQDLIYNFYQINDARVPYNNAFSWDGNAGGSGMSSAGSSKFRDPINNATYNYFLVFPDNTVIYNQGPNAIFLGGRGPVCPLFNSASNMGAGSMLWFAGAKLEISNDPDIQKSYNNCLNNYTYTFPLAGPPANTNYYVCSE